MTKIVLPVDKGVPIPPVDTDPRKRATDTRYVIGLDRLDVGDSVFIPYARNAPKVQMHDLKMRHGRLFAFRTFRAEDGSVPGIRVWRTY